MMKSPLLLAVVYFTLLAVTVVTLPPGAVRAQGSGDVSLEQQIQAALASAGFDPGPADGKFGPKTRTAIQAWQRANGHAGTGYLTRDQLRSILEETTVEPFGPNWIVAENQPCQLYNPHPMAGETVTWSGGCVNGKASGEGRRVWRAPSYGEDVYEGEYRDGKVHGHGTRTSPSGDRYEGEYRDGKAHGWGTVTTSSGATFSGEWRDGCVGGQGYATWMAMGTSAADCGFE